MGKGSVKSEQVFCSDIIDRPNNSSFLNWPFKN